MNDYELKSLRRELTKLRTVLVCLTTIIITWFAMWLRNNL